MILCHRSVFIFKELVYPSAHVSMFCKTFPAVIDETRTGQCHSFAKTRSSRSEVFCKKDVLRNFTKFTGKDLVQSLSFNNVAGLLLICILLGGSSVSSKLIWKSLLGKFTLQVIDRRFHLKISYSCDIGLLSLIEHLEHPCSRLTLMATKLDSILICLQLKGQYMLGLMNS